MALPCTSCFSLVPLHNNVTVTFGVSATIIGLCYYILYGVFGLSFLEFKSSSSINGGFRSIFVFLGVILNSSFMLGKFFMCVSYSCECLVLCLCVLSLYNCLCTICLYAICLCDICVVCLLSLS